MGVTKLKEVSNGAVVIECNNDSERDILQPNLKSKLGNGYQITMPKLKRPIFKITVMDQDEEGSEEGKILSAIVNQNDLSNYKDSESMKIIYKKFNKKYHNVTISVESEPAIFNEVIRRGRLNIGWKRCKIIEDVYIKRCYKCWGFNHMARDCKEDQRCGMCAEGHDRKDCKAKRKKCINCVNWRIV